MNKHECPEGDVPKDTFFNLSDEKRSWIIEAAIGEFENNHFDQASINRIITRADIPKGSFYQYFTDKKDVYTYILQLIIEAKMKYLTPIMANPFDHPFKVVLHDMFASGLRFAKDHPRFMRIGTRLIQDKTHRVYLEIMGNNQIRAEEVYALLLKKGVERGELRKDLDVSFLAHTIFALSNNLIEYNSDLSQDDWLDTMFESLEKLLDVIFTGIRNPNTIYDKNFREEL